MKKNILNQPLLKLGLFCLVAAAISFSSGCSSFPWSKNKDKIYSPKPAYKKLEKKSKKPTGRPSETVEDFLSSPRTW